jgi:competence protein ComEC
VSPAGERSPQPLLARPFHIGVGSLTIGLALSPALPAAVIAAATAVAAVLLLVARGGPALARGPAPARGGPAPARAARSFAFLAAALVLAGAAVGDARIRAIDASASRIRDGAVRELRVYVASPSRPTPFGSSAEVEVGGGRFGGARLLLRVPRWARLPPGVGVGQELLVSGRLRALRSEPGAGFDFAALLRRRGISGELFLDRALATRRRRGGVAGLLDGMRRRAERAVAAGLPEPEAALARGMVLGQDERIDEATRQDWRDSGLAHLLAVSGQNVMLLVALAVPLLALAHVGPRGRGAALLALVALYVPLAGAGPSLQRAGIMGIAGIVAMTLARPASRWYALLLAAAVTLAVNPHVSADPGWQLSFAAVAGILAVGRPLAGMLTDAGGELLRERPRPVARALVRGLAEAVAITVAAALATAPLVSFHFGAVPVAGLIANLLALPAVAPAMWLGMVKAALGIAAIAFPPADSLAELLGPPARLPLAYLERLAERCADLPGGRLTLPLDSPAAVIAAYAVVIAGAFAIRAFLRKSRRQGIAGGLAEDRAERAATDGEGRSASSDRRSVRGDRGRRGSRRRRGRPDFAERAAAWRRAPRSFRVAVMVLVLAALALATASGLGSPSPPGDLTVRFLDIGQGDATLIQHPEGTAVLFDGGPPEGGVTRLLRRAGVSRLAIVVATHASRDHHGGLVDVLHRYPVALLLDGGDGNPHPGLEAVRDEAARRQVRVVPAVAPMTLRAGGLRIHVLSPLPRPAGPAPEDPNPRAVVAIVSSGAFDLLLSADAESEALLPLDLPDVEAMKVPHHGSSDPGLPEVLRRLRPEIAGIEVGLNSYGHPTPSTLAALEHAGVTTYRTDRDGTVTLTVTHGQMKVATEH